MTIRSIYISKLYMFETYRSLIYFVPSTTFRFTYCCNLHFNYMYVYLYLQATRTSKIENLLFKFSYIYCGFSHYQFSIFSPSGRNSKDIVNVILINYRGTRFYQLTKDFLYTSDEMFQDKYCFKRSSCDITA